MVTVRTSVNGRKQQRGTDHWAHGGQSNQSLGREYHGQWKQRRVAIIGTNTSTDTNTKLRLARRTGRCEKWKDGRRWNWPNRIWLASRLTD